MYNIFQISGLSVVGRSTQRALNLKKNWVSTDASPGLAASVISNNKENTAKSLIINTKDEAKGAEDMIQHSSVTSNGLKKEVDQSKVMPSPLTKFEPRPVLSISASISANRGMYNKESGTSDKNVDVRLKSHSDRLSSLQSLLKVLIFFKGYMLNLYRQNKSYPGFD